MPLNLHGRSLTKLLDFSPSEITALLDLSASLKAARRGGYEVPRLGGKHIALIFEKTSTRTRCAFEVAAKDQGAHTTYLGPGDSQMGHKESVADTARVLGRMYDGIQYRGFAQATVEALAEHAGVPVWNGLTDDYHPTQVLADALTMQEHATKPLREVAFAFLGDARNNMGNSLLVGGAKLGMDVRLVAPTAYWPNDDLVTTCRSIAEGTGARLTLTEDVAEGVRGADFVHTDVWLSMGEPEAAWEARIRDLSPYQVDARVMGLTQNPHARFMHCLPAFHDRRTAVGERLHQLTGRDALEVTDAVFESPASIVFDQAENRLHTIKAVLVATLGG